MEDNEQGAGLPQETVLVLNGVGKRIGGLCLDLDSGCLFLITDNHVDQFRAHIGFLLTSLNPSRVVFSVRLNEEIIDFIREQSLEKNFTNDTMASKLFHGEPSKRCLEEFITSVAELQNGVLLSLLTELKYGEELSLARNAFSALKSTIVNLETLDDTPLELKNVIQSADIVVLKNHMYIDQDTLYALNIFNWTGQPNTSHKGPKLCLFDLYNSLVGSGMGHKTLNNWFHFPLAKEDLINKRLVMVEMLISDDSTRYLPELANLMKKLTNINHILSSFQKGKMNLAIWTNLKSFLEVCIEIGTIIEQLSSFNPIEFCISFQEIVDVPHLRALLRNLNHVIDFESSKDWQRVYVRDGLHEMLDNLKQKYNDLELTLSDVTLEITKRYPLILEDLVNVVYIPQLGYLISINILNGSPTDIPSCWVEVFQTATNVYLKDDLMESMDESYGDVYQLMVDVEIEILFDLKNLVLDYAPSLKMIGTYLAELDCFCAFASVALLNDFVKPDIVEDPILMVKNGRNPITEQHVDSYIANDTLLNSGVVSIITGANASGKSVYLQQIGMIVFLSHIGSYVPASSAEIGITDRLLTRMVTRESLDKCESTFFIDLHNMSKCLRLKTERSVLLIDEFGKGTDILGGPSMLGAIIEEIADAGAAGSRTILTTHFHELFEKGIIKDSDNIKHNHMEIYFLNENNNSRDITYLYNLKDGLAKNSFGIHCAEVCGIEPSIIKRAYEILETENCLKHELNEIDNVERLKITTREFLLWDLEKESSSEQEIRERLGDILNNVTTDGAN